jgi:hypothetical protein
MREKQLSLFFVALALIVLMTVPAFPAIAPNGARAFLVAYGRDTNDT